MGRKTVVGLAVVFLLFIVTALVFYFPIFLGKIPLNGNLLVAFFNPWRQLTPFKLIGVDEIREFYPLLDFTYDLMRTGSVPLWNPYNFSGYPHFANWASAIFYPLSMTFLLLSKIQILIFLKLSAIILSGFFTYLYLRSLTLGKLSAFFGGTAFALSAPMLIWGAEIWQAVHSMLWLPLALFSIEKLINTKKLFYVVLLAFSIAASITAGYIQPTIYLFIFILSYLIFRAKAITKKTLALFAGGLILGLGLSAIQIIPGAEAFLLSPRKEISLSDVNLDFLLSPIQLLTIFIPDIFGHIATQNWFLQRPGQYYENMTYVGIVPLVLSLLALFNAKLRSYVIFFLIAAIATLSSIFDLPTSRLIYQLHVPFLSTAIPIRIILVTAFSLSVLSALGMEVLLKGGIRIKKAFFLLLPLLALYLAIAVWLMWSFMQKSSLLSFPPNWYIISLRNLILPLIIFLVTTVVILGAIKFPRYKKPAFVALTVILLFHSLIFFQKYAAFTEIKFIYPQHPLLAYLQAHQGLYRYWSYYGRASLTNNFATVYEIYSPEGYDPVNIKNYNELISSVNTGDLRGIASRSDAVIPTSEIYPLEDTNQKRLRLLDLLGVKFIGYYNQEQKEDKNNDRFSLLWQDNGFMIFENKKAFARAFLVSEVISTTSDQEAISLIYDPQTDLSKKIILQEKTERLIPDYSSQGAVKITEYQPSRVAIRTSTDAPQFLVLSDAYYPGWQATINGVPTKIYRADYALRAVLAPAGESEVVFTYRPKSFTYGSLVSGISLLFVVAIIFIRRKEKR